VFGHSGQGFNAKEPGNQLRTKIWSCCSRHWVGLINANHFFNSTIMALSSMALSSGVFPLKHKKSQRHAPALSKS
jgi:hypothetical protein